MRTFLSIGLVAALLAPVAAAAPALHARSIGEIFVDAAGHASGLNLAAHIAEAEGVLVGFRAVALDQDVFARVEIDGFEQAAKIQGVGSSVVALRGRNAEVLLHDNINSVLEVRASTATTIRYHLADGVTASALDRSRAVVDLHAEEAYVGSIVAVGGDGPDARGERLHVIKDSVHARTRAGTQVVFVARPAYVADEAYAKAIVSALSEGLLAASYVTELDGSAVAASQIDFGRAKVSTVADAAGVRTTVDAQGRPLLVSYDLAYETLPARTAEDVSVYVDGQLAQRAASASEVLAGIHDGLPLYHTYVQDGRAQVLAATPDFRATSSHTISLAASAKASTEAQARAEQRTEEGSRVLGDFSYSASGKLLGDFVTAIVPEGASELRSYTSLSSRVEVFRAVALPGNAGGTFVESGHRLVMDGPRANVTLSDDAYATLQVEAKQPMNATFALADGIRARAESQDVVVVDGPRGRLGMLVIVEPDGQPRAASRLAIERDGSVTAVLASGSRIAFQGVSGSFASDDVLAEGIARGHVGAHLLAGQQGEALATTGSEFVPGVAASARAEGRRIAVDYASAIERSGSFVLDARGSALLAKAPEDVVVTVDGVPAQPVGSPQAVFEVAGFARYYAETSGNGDLRVLVNVAKDAGEHASVLIGSRLDGAARAALGTDAFGTFKVFYDGTAVGNFVRFRADKAAGALSDFGMVADAEPVFASLVAGKSAFTSNGLDGATTLVLENREARIEAADATTGYLKVVAKERTEAAFRVSSDLSALRRSDRVLEIRDEAGAHVGSLVANGGTLDVQGDAIRASLRQGGQVLYRAHVGLETELSDAQRSMLNEAMAAGRLAGQVLVRPGPAGSALEATSGAAVDAVTSEYSDVKMITAATRHRVDVTLSSDSHVGRTLMIALDPKTLGGLADGNAVVLFDGVPVTEADSFADVLDATDDGAVAEYLVLAGESGTQVLVSVPYFSVHTVTLQEKTQDESNLYVYAIVVLGAIALVEGAAVLALRRRRA